jgi:hypothetical protein
MKVIRTYDVISAIGNPWVAFVRYIIVPEVVYDDEQRKLLTRNPDAGAIS